MQIVSAVVLEGKRARHNGVQIGRKKAADAVQRRPG